MPVASTKFDFDAVLTIDRSLDLVVLIDTAIWNEERTRRQIQALGRALDLLGSRRTLTAVMIGPEPTQVTLEALTKVCRVLPVGVWDSLDGDRRLRDWLAVLLPLTLPAADEAGADWRQELHSSLGLTRLPPHTQRFVAAATGGEERVARELNDAIDDTLIPIASELRQ